MRSAFLFLLVVLSCIKVWAGTGDSVLVIGMPDSLKAVGLLSRFSVDAIDGKKNIKAGIALSGISIYIEASKREREVVMEFPKSAKLKAAGIGVEVDKGECTWDFDWKLNETYELYMATASDSAENFTIYSGYIHFPETNKWKLIGTVELAGKWGFQSSGNQFFSNSSKKKIHLATDQVWIQRSSGWKAVTNPDAKWPVLLPFSNMDSLDQSAIDEQFIRQAMQSGKLENMKPIESVYYSIISEGSGLPVKVTDTITVNYKGYLLSDGRVFDQTKTAPATFPLARLIKGWQLALPACKIGGKIKIVIPSGQSYGIRTRGPKIPPNSILVFEIEVLKAN